MNTVPALRATGAAPVAIIPQSIEESWRVAEMIVLGKLAPYSMIGKLEGKAAISAVTACLLYGLELGLPPMKALTTIAVINGKPALYSDGLIAVIRGKRGVCEYLKTGMAKRGDFGIMRAAGELGSGSEKEQRELYDSLTEDEKVFGWCSAKRADTNEEKTVIFSRAQAKKAGLWDERTIVKRNIKGEWREIPNDAPWFKYPERMMGWRAAGYCLRDLFADVLAGIYTVEELGPTIEADYHVDESANPGPPSATALLEQEQEAASGEPDPAEDEAEAPTIDHEQDADSEPEKSTPPPSVADLFSRDDPEPDADPDWDSSRAAVIDFIEQIKDGMQMCKTVDQIDELWSENDVEAILTELPDLLESLTEKKQEHYARLSPLAGG